MSKTERAREFKGIKNPKKMEPQNPEYKDYAEKRQRKQERVGITCRRRRKRGPSRDEGLLGEPAEEVEEAAVARRRLRNLLSQLF